MVAFGSSLLVTVAAIGVVVLVGIKRKPGTPLTWGEAMVAAVFVFFIFFWSYGMVPHQWLNFADNELGWTPDNVVYGPFNVFKPQVLGGSFPFTLNYQVVRDLIVVGIYVVFLGLNVAAWAIWNDRSKRAEAKAKELETSDYGRPLVRRG